MFDELKILNDASALAKYSARRQEVIAENIANVNTPGYVARDLEPFQSVYAEKDVSKAIDGMRPIESKSAGEPSPNGNTVSLQVELMRGVENEARHETAVTVYRKAMDILKMSLGRS
ncbi:MAG: flagellar basal body protein [Pseudomonadota bacterium]